MFFPSGEHTNWTVAHVAIVSLVTALASSCLDTSNFSLIFQICDKRVAGIYITLLAAITNMSSFIHKFYIFWAVDKFGLFAPTVFISFVAFGLALYLKKRIEKLDELPKESWAVSDSILKRVKAE